MSKRKKRNKGKCKAITCPVVKVVKIKQKKIGLTALEMEELCNKVMLTKHRINLV